MSIFDPEGVVQLTSIIYKQMMRKQSLLMIAILFGIAVSAQGQNPKDEMNRLRQLITQPKSRAPLPRLMSNDQACVDELYDLSKWDEQTAKLKADSIQKRHEENKFIQEHKNLAGEKNLKSGKYDEILRSIEREELRYALYEKECEISAANREADQRPEPKGELLSVSYGSSGMMHNPDLPFTITKENDNSAIVSYSYLEHKFKVDRKYLDMMREAIIKEHLYQLHSNYEFKSWDLPDVPKEILLDGQSWNFQAEFSDGTIISSYGTAMPGPDIDVIPKIYFESIFPNSPAYKARKANREP